MASTDPNVKIFLLYVSGISMISLSDNAVINGVNYLANTALIANTRVV
jgi:hypothetical protein